MGTHPIFESDFRLSNRNNEAMPMNEPEPEVRGHRIGTRKSLFVRPITADTRPDELKLEFAKFGEVVDVHVPCDFKTRTPRGFAYIEFVDDEAAAMAQEKADGMELAGKKLTVKFADGERKSAGQMKGQKESRKLKIELDRLKKMQEEQRGRILNEIEKQKQARRQAREQERHVKGGKNRKGHKRSASSSPSSSSSSARSSSESSGSRYSVSHEKISILYPCFDYFKKYEILRQMHTLFDIKV